MPGDESRSGTVTRLLNDVGAGSARAVDDLLPLVYDELKALAAGKLRAERDDHTLNTTALVHEAYLKLVDQTRVEWQSRAHFFAVAAQAMRRILINYAKMTNAAKRGGGVPLLALDEAGGEFSAGQADELVALDAALDELEQFNERGARVVTYRFFGGLTYEEIADVLGVSPITVRRAWDTARAWLRRRLRDDFPDGPAALGGQGPRR
jgi:RNA polymerase sigma factor (TIGR02999 family)